ncbi:hypothetical protein F5Y16DRAFT_150759 [Xylariaceae sp. FL0255]|nr:hypothetical protein F5Y16DRAFT_150759 [Xylariaceae sp. FL0255]
MMHVSDWLLDLPRHIVPFSMAPSPSLPRLPSIHMLTGCHAGAYHYFLVSLTFLVVFSPSLSLLEPITNLASSIGISLAQGGNQADLLELIALEICGIAFSSKELPVLVNAFGPISYCELP